MSVLVVTGTGTGVGKTIATAALAACAQGRVAIVKPAQTGMAPAPGEPSDAGDLAEITRLTGITDVHEFARYPDPLSPHHAAQRSGLPALDFADTLRRITDLDAVHDLVLVEGAGGLLVPFSNDGWTLADLAATMRAPAAVVTDPGLGTLNHTGLTVDRLAEDRIELAGIVIGSWPVAPAEPDLAMRCNVADLAAMGPLVGVLPARMSAMRDFGTRARAAVAPRFGGTFDAAAFVATTR